jgi:hypothetical protein
MHAARADALAAQAKQQGNDEPWCRADVAKAMTSCADE